MARIEGTGEKPKRAWRLPRLEARPVGAFVLLAPVVLLAPDTFISAAVLAVVIPAAWLYGYHEGRSDKAREVLLELRSNDR